MWTDGPRVVDPPQGMVSLAVPAAVQAVAPDLPRGRRDRGDAAQVRPGGLAAQPLRVIPGRDQQQGRSVRADAVKAEQAGGAGGDERDDEVIEPVELAVEELHAPAQLPKRDPERVVRGVTRAGPQGSDRLGQRGSALPGEPGPHLAN